MEFVQKTTTNVDPSGNKMKIESLETLRKRIESQYEQNILAIYVTRTSPRDGVPSIVMLFAPLHSAEFRPSTPPVYIFENPLLYGRIVLTGPNNHIQPRKIEFYWDEDVSGYRDLVQKTRFGLIGKSNFVYDGGLDRPLIVEFSNNKTLVAEDVWKLISLLKILGDKSHALYQPLYKIFEQKYSKPKQTLNAS